VIILSFYFGDDKQTKTKFGGYTNIATIPTPYTAFIFGEGGREIFGGYVILKSTPIVFGGYAVITAQPTPTPTPTPIGVLLPNWIIQLLLLLIIILVLILIIKLLR